MKKIYLKRADAVQMRQALETVAALKNAGVLFVPIPVLDNVDHTVLLATLSKRLDRMAADAEKEEAENEIQKL